MKLLLPVLVLISISLSAAVNFNTTTIKCDSSPLNFIFEQYNKGHPYRDVNSGKPSSHWQMRKYNVHYNNLKDYNIRNNIGSGSFSSVAKVRHLPTDAEYVFKRLVDDDVKAMKKEIQVMKEIANIPNVIPIRDIIKEEYTNGETTLGLMFDYFNAQNFHKVFKRFTKAEIKFFIYETLRTLQEAHSRGIVHRDIKPLNVLMNANTMQLRVIDWGQSDFYRPNKWYSNYVSSLHYMAPELVLDFHYHDYALDIWSTGCMFAEMIFRKSSFFRADYYTPRPDDDDSQFDNGIHQRNKEHLEAIAKILGTNKLRQYANKFKDFMRLEQLDRMPEYKKVPLTEFINTKNAHLVDSQALDLLDKMFTYDHTRRITAAEALKHPYFDELRGTRVSSGSKPSNKFNLGRWVNTFTQISK